MVQIFGSVSLGNDSETKGLPDALRVDTECTETRMATLRSWYAFFTALSSELHFTLPFWGTSGTSIY